MTKGKWSSRLLLLVLLVFFCLPAAAQAEVVTGQAVIENETAVQQEKMPARMQCEPLWKIRSVYILRAAPRV